MTRYAVALGSNLGERLVHLRAGMDGLARLGEVKAVSGLYETEPVGGPDQPPYLNAVATVDSDLDPHVFMARLHDIEAERGRERPVRWGPRTLDLDLVAMTPGSVDGPALTVPHPRAAERGFVVFPLVEIWPEAELGKGLTAAGAAARLPPGGVDRLAYAWWPTRAEAGARWLAAQAALLILVVVCLVADSDPVWPDRPLLSIVGLVLLGSGLGLTVSSSLSLGSALRAAPEPRAGAFLVEHGPYALVRHPIYGGVILTFVGLSVIVGSWWALLASLLLLPFFWGKSTYEESQLRIAYPGYRAYRKRVRRRMIPYLL